MDLFTRKLYKFSSIMWNCIMFHKNHVNHVLPRQVCTIECLTMESGGQKKRRFGFITSQDQSKPKICPGPFIFAMSQNDHSNG